MTESSDRNELKDYEKNTLLHEQVLSKEEVVVKGSSSNSRMDIEEGRTFDEVAPSDRSIGSKSTSSSDESSNGVKSNENDGNKERISSKNMMMMSNDDSFASSFLGIEKGSSKGNGLNVQRSSGNEWGSSIEQQSIVKQNRRFSWIQIKQVKHDVHTGYIKCSASNDQGTAESEVTRIHIQRKYSIFVPELFSPNICS